MAQTQKIYLGEHPIEDIRYGSHKIITALHGEPGRIIDSSTVLFLDSTDTDSYAGSGDTWYDLSASGNNAVGDAITNYWDTNGYFDFPGTSELQDTALVTGDSSMNIFDGDFTIQFVMTIDTTATGTLDLTAPFGIDSFNANPGLGFLINRDSGAAGYAKLNMRINNSNIGESSSALWSTLGDWFVVQIVRSGTSLVYYLNNVSIGSFTNSTNGNNTNDVFIGRARRDLARYPMAGKLANIALYDKALTNAERLTNLNYFKEKLGF